MSVTQAEIDQATLAAVKLQLLLLLLLLLLTMHLLIQSKLT